MASGERRRPDWESTRGGSFVTALDPVTGEVLEEERADDEHDDGWEPFGDSLLTAEIEFETGVRAGEDTWSPRAREIGTGEELWNTPMGVGEAGCTPRGTSENIALVGDVVVVPHLCAGPEGTRTIRLFRSTRRCTRPWPST
ncbi:hypothetical protein [Nocardiopsis sp. MG754419]|uniref:hypothetical protein n=1 Tax=Nocardiopsis sp. MG754419 TaxID=2259865 RepID=UPI001BA46ECA|nr:hypothetical protein [Nocardiopsis sp. MG754419]MBR8740150.1 hypothetical protein [Nocardiopsis sp. MG754419]